MDIQRLPGKIKMSVSVPTSTVKFRSALTLGPVTLFRERSLHSRTGEPYVSAVGYRVSGGGIKLSTSYLVVGLLVAWLMGMSMVDPMAWVTVLLWPAVVVMEMFVFMVKAAVVVGLIVGLLMLVEKVQRSMRRRRYSR